MSVDKFGRHSSSQIYIEPGVSVRYASNNFLKRDGSNDVAGDINFNNNRITTLADPAEDQDASTKAYVDTKVNKSGDTMSGDLDMNENKITGLTIPTNSRDAANKHYVDASVGVTFEEESIISINQAHGKPSQQPDKNWLEESSDDSRDEDVEVVSKTIGGETKDVIRLYNRTIAHFEGLVSIRYKNPDAALAKMKSNEFTIEIKDFAFIGYWESNTRIYIGDGVRMYTFELGISDYRELVINGAAEIGGNEQYRDIKIEANANFGTAKIYVDNEYITRTTASANSRKGIQFFSSSRGTRDIDHEIFFREIIITSSILTGGGKRIINVGDPINDQDVVNKRYADRNFIKKPIITIWAQQKGVLRAGNYEWSFGAGDMNARSGYCMPVSGRIIRGCLSSNNNQNASGLCTVSITIAGQSDPQLLIKPSNTYSSVITFNPPIEVSQYDLINFRTASNAAATNSLVSLLIELDL